MAFTRIYLLPVMVFIIVPVSFLTTYTIAVLNEHVDPAFPYISDTGSYSPESCIFGQLLNIAAFIIAICVYIKYLEVNNFQQTITSKGGISHRFNKVTSAFGLLSCIGMDIVANFQESNVIVVHLLGAILCFGAGTIYFSLQLWISYKVPGLTSKRLLLTRAILVGICVLTTISTVVTATLALSEYRGSTNNPQKWNPEDGGWELHLVSTISEWILVITYCILILSFVPEFYDLEFEAPVITFKNKRTFT